MSQAERDLRPDQLALYPMQLALDNQERTRLHGGMTLWLISMSIPVLLLIEVRYVLAGGYVDPVAHPWIGGMGLLAMVIVGVLLTSADKATKNANRKAVLNYYGWAFWFTLATIVLIGWQVVNRSMSLVSHYGMMYMATAGTADFYVVCGLLAIVAARGRVKRLDAGIRNYWGIHATGTYWWFITVVWLALYIILYFA